jgi:hypothetical protein
MIKIEQKNVDTSILIKIKLNKLHNDFPIDIVQCDAKCNVCIKFNNFNSQHKFLLSIIWINMKHLSWNMHCKQLIDLLQHFHKIETLE